MKLLYVFLLILIFNVGIKAEGECEVITYYSKEAWVDYYNFIPERFDDNLNAINKNNIIFKLNALGTLSRNNSVNQDAINGLAPLQISSNIYPTDQRYFSIEIFKEIKVEEIELELNALNIDGTHKNIKVYLNGVMGWVNSVSTLIDGDLIYSGSSKDRITIDIDLQNTTSILVVVDDIKEDDVYTLKYFQINKYQVFEHESWTKEYISGANTYSEEICLSVGEYKPNGTNKYVYSANSSISVDASLISSYEPYIASQFGAYDYGRGNYIPAYSMPNIVKTIDQYAYLILGWTKNGNTYVSKGDYNDYVRINDDTGIKYVANAIHWSLENQNNKIHMSYSKDWCYHTTGNYTAPCYKYMGHSNNARLNSYDVSVYTYKNYIKKEDQVLSHGDYFLYDVNNKEKKYLFRSSENNVEFTLNQTGEYKIISTLYDKVNNHVELKSNSFYIDQKPPNINYSPASSGWTNKPLNVVVDINDEHSGLKDTNISYKEYLINNNELLFTKEGIYKLNAYAIDNVGNETIKESETYKLDFTKPKVEFDYGEDLVNIAVSDELSKLQYFVYQISYDQGNTFNNTSHKIYGPNLTLYLMKNKSIIVRVIAYDNANNIAIVDSKIIETYESTAFIGKVFSTIYEINQESEILVNVECTGCLEDETREFKTYVNDMLVNTTNVLVNNSELDIKLTYRPIEYESNIKIEMYKEGELETAINLKTYAKSYAYQINNNTINHQGIVASYRESNQSQIDYYEYLIVDNISENNTMFQGQGLNVNANIDYHNECISFIDWKCNHSDYLEKITPIFIIDNGALPYSEVFKYGDLYQISMLVENNNLILPNTYVDIFTGEVFKENDENRISGLNKWYLDKDIKLGKHEALIKDSLVGINKFSYELIIDYIVDEKLEDQYDARFINPNNPYLDDNSIWINNDWLSTLEMR